MFIGPRQKLLIRRAVTVGVIRVTSRVDKDSALHAHDRGLLRRGIDSEHYHPTPLAREVIDWHLPATTTSETSWEDEVTSVTIPQRTEDGL